MTTTSRPAASRARAVSWSVRSRSTPTPPTKSVNPSVAASADGDFVVTWFSITPGRLTTAASSPADSRAPALRWGASSRSTPTPSTIREMLRSQPLPTATSSSLGRATSRTARAAVSSLAASRAPARCSRRRVPGQHVHHRATRALLRWRSMPKETSSSSGRASPRTTAQLRRVRPPVLERGRRPRELSSRSARTPRDTSETPVGRG